MDWSKFEVEDDHLIETLGAMMKAKESDKETLLLSFLNQTNGPINRRFIQADGRFKQESVEAYLTLHDESCRVVSCALSSIFAQGCQVEERRSTYSVTPMVRRLETCTLPAAR